MKLAELRRELDWRLQGLLRWSPTPRKRDALPAARFGEGLDAAGRAALAALAVRYPLDRWEGLCTRHELHDSLYLLDLLDRHLGRPPAGSVGLDIGSAAWGYLPALALWSGGRWDGVEIDAHRRHVTGVTRRGYGEWMAARLPGCRYLSTSLLEVKGEYDLITWLLPLLTTERTAAHRLPRRLFQPEALLRHAWSLLTPGGTLFTTHQGEEEAALQEALFHRCGIAAQPLGELASPLYPYRHPRFGWIARKP